MSDQGEPAGPAESAGSTGSADSAGSDERGGRDGGGTGRGGADRGGADRGDHAGPARPDGRRPAPSRYSAPVRITIGTLGPVLLTIAYFTLPFDPIGPEHRILAWVILVGLLTFLALGMVVTTTRALTDEGGRFRHPGVGILLLSWTAILAFAASNWAMAAHGEFVGLQTRLDALYFTGITMATVGYGDIHPSGQLARAVVLVQLVYTFSFLVSGVTAVRTRNQARRTRRPSAGG